MIGRKIAAARRRYFGVDSEIIHSMLMNRWVKKTLPAFNFLGVCSTLSTWEERAAASANCIAETYERSHITRYASDCLHPFSSSSGLSFRVGIRKQITRSFGDEMRRVQHWQNELSVNVTQVTLTFSAAFAATMPMLIHGHGKANWFVLLRMTMIRKQETKETNPASVYQSSEIAYSQARFYQVDLCAAQWWTPTVPRSTSSTPRIIIIITFISGNKAHIQHKLHYISIRLVMWQIF